MHSIQLSAGRPSGYLEPTELGRMWLQKNNIGLSAGFALLFLAVAVKLHEKSMPKRL